MMQPMSSSITCNNDYDISNDKDDVMTLEETIYDLESIPSRTDDQIRMEMFDQIIHDCFIKKLVQCTNDLAFIYIVLEKCYNSKLLTKIQHQSYMMEALVQTNAILTKMKKTTCDNDDADDADDAEKQQQLIKEEDANFKLILERAIMEENVSMDGSGDVELREFIGVKAKERSTDLHVMVPYLTNLNARIDHFEECLKNMKQADDDINNIRIRAFCAVAYLLFDTIASECSGDAISTLLEITKPPLVCRINDLRNKENVEGALMSMTHGNEYEDVMKNSIEYVGNLELHRFSHGDIVNVASDIMNGNNDEQEKLIIIKRVLMLEIAMVATILVQLDDHEDDIDSITNILELHRSVASIQVKGCEKLSSLAREVLTYEQSQSAANTVVEAMRNHEENTSIQTLGCEVIRSLRATMIREQSTSLGKSSHTNNETYATRFCRTFCCVKD